MVKDEEVQSTHRFPKELHTKARMEALRTGRSLNDILEELVKLWLDGKIKLEDLEKET